MSKSAPRAPTSAVPRASSALADPPSRLLAGYRLVRALGKGGLGEVYEAIAPDGRTVALKAFQLRDDDQGLVASAFVREANLGARLEHPDIVKVLDTGCFDDYAYVVMEFVPGHDLRKHTLPAHRLPVTQVLRTAERIARALAAAHAIHVVHRDVKPGNVLVHWPTDIIKVSDFGLARLGDAFRSRTGIVAGTPGYMPPEQLLGHVGPRADLYAFGATLLHALTGIPPHDFPFDSGRIEVPRELPAPRLRRLVHALLEPAPRDRPASAAAARALLRDEPAAGSTAALAPVRTSVPAVLAGDGPQYVDLGPPPRDPEGEHADVYLTLTDPLNDLRNAPSALAKLGAFTWMSLVGVFTLGILPLWWLSDRQSRRNRFGRLFREGELVRIRDVARVELTRRDQGLRVHTNARPGASVVVRKKSGADILDTVDACPDVAGVPTIAGLIAADAVDREYAGRTDEQVALAATHALHRWSLALTDTLTDTDLVIP